MSDRSKYLAAVKFLVDDNQKLRQERDKLHEGIEQLIEDYEGRIRTVNDLISEKHGDNEIQKRLSIKQSSYRTFITELKRLLKD